MTARQPKHSASGAGPRDAGKQRPARITTNGVHAAPSLGIPAWPGWVVAFICGIVYLSVGVGQFGVRPSGSSHHAITASAWLKGRTYATREELESAYIRRQLRAANRAPSASATHDEVYALWRERRAPGLRQQGFNEPQIDLELRRVLRGALHDWVRLGDRFYAYWPPMPVVLMLPLVLISGANASDILLTNLIGGITVLFVYYMLRELGRHWPPLTTPACAGLALFYGLGTCHFWQSCVGQVWFLTQITGTMFLVVAVWFGFRAISCPAWLIPAGLALGLGFLSRNTIVLAAPFFAVILWMAVRQASRPWVEYIKWGSCFAAMIVACIGVQFALNHVRFGSWKDFGQGHLADAGGNPRFRADFEKYGRFHPHYVPRNLYYYLVNPTTRVHPRTQLRSFDPDGNSLFLLSMPMVFALLCWRVRGPLLWAALAGAAPGAIMLMFFHGTGFYTFGPRYLLDSLPLILILAAFGLRGRLSPVVIPMILLSIAVNSWGTRAFCMEQPP